MKIIEELLQKLAHAQVKYRTQFIIATIILTLIFLIGVPQIQMQTDTMEGMPQDLPIFELNDRVTQTFGGNDVVVIITQIDKTINDPRAISDLRDPQTTEFIQHLEDKLMQESNIDSVTSINTFMQGASFESPEQVRNFLENVASANDFFSKDYTTIITYVTADVGSSQAKVNELVDTIEKNLNLVAQVPGTKTYVTGSPIISATLGNLLTMDALTSIGVALLAIFLLLLVLKKSLLKTCIVMLPLIIGLIWTIGTLGFANIKLTIATAGLGAMILGLGVEYSVFVLTRYLEERDKNKSQDEALTIAIPAVGTAIAGSGLTTLIGFLALTLSVIPMLRELGLTLAIGILSVLVSAVIISPTIFTLVESKHLENIKKKRKNIFTNH